MLDRTASPSWLRDTRSTVIIHKRATKPRRRNPTVTISVEEFEILSAALAALQKIDWRRSTIVGTRHKPSSAPGLIDEHICASHCAVPVSSCSRYASLLWAGHALPCRVLSCAANRALYEGTQDNILIRSVLDEW